jgi:hypothetical protein
MFQELIKCAKSKDINLKPRLILCDFELAAINAIKTSFENVEVKGCHFHFSQAIKKHIKTSGFETEYTHEIKTKKSSFCLLQIKNKRVY